MYGRIDGPVDGEIPAPLQAVWDSLSEILPAEAARADESHLRLCLRTIAFLAVTGALLVPYLALLPFGRRAPNAIARLWHRIACRLCGLRFWVNGAPASDSVSAYVANHVSYLDIPVLGSLVDGTFVAKSEVSEWPLFGFLARLQQTVFISRNPRRANEDCTRLRSRVDRGESLILFPEGTSSDGRQVLPFHSSIFAGLQSADGNCGEGGLIQPVSITYPRYADGRPLIAGMRNTYAWHGDMTMFEHLIGVFSHKGALVEITFHPPVRASQFAGRKDLARHCQQVIAESVAEAHTRRIYLTAGTGSQLWASLFRA